MSLGKRIKYYRLRQGIRQIELAEILLLRRQTVSRWERDISTPTITDLVGMAFLFHISLEDLLRDEIIDFKYQQAESIQKKMMSLPVRKPQLENHPKTLNESDEKDADKQSNIKLTRL